MAIWCPLARSTGLGRGGLFVDDELLSVEPLGYNLDLGWETPFLGESLDQLERWSAEFAACWLKLHPVAELASVIAILSLLHTERVEARLSFRQ